MAEPTPEQLQQDIAHISRNSSLARVLNHFNGFGGVDLTDAQLRAHINEAARRDPSLHRILSHHAGFIELTDEQVATDISEAGRRISSLHQALENVEAGPLALLGTAPDLYGRQGVGVPDGVVLPEVSGGRRPYTYSVTGLPAGTSFTAATHTLGGTPTADGDNTVTFQVEDAEGTTVMDTFDWDILDVLATDGIQLQDIDGGKYGYGVSDVEPLFAMTLVSGADPSTTTDTNFWQRAPNTVVGSIVDDPFAMPTMSDMGIVARLRHRANTNPVRWYIYDADQDADGNAVTSSVEDWVNANTDATIYVQRALGTIGLEIPLSPAVFDNDNFARWDLDATESAWCVANLADGDQFIIWVA